MLFNIYSELIVRNVLDNWEGGITVNGTKINNVRYADDMILIASSKEELEEFRVEEKSMEDGFQINKKNRNNDGRPKKK